MEENYKKDSQPAPTSETYGFVLKRGFAEFIASILFIFCSCGAAVATQRFQTAGAIVIEIALAFGLCLTALCFAVGHISGGHLNSVVSLCFALTGKITWKRFIFYFFAHFLGGMVGAALLRFVSPSAWNGGCLAANRVQVVGVGQAFLMELILTFFLMLVINAAADANKSNQVLVPLAIGLCVTVCHFLAIPLTGCSLNPTRSFASAAAASGLPGCDDVWNNHWIFWIACPLGGVLATFMYENAFLDQHEAGGMLKQVGDVVRTTVPFLDFHDPPAGGRAPSSSFASSSNNSGTKASRKTDLSSVDIPTSDGHVEFEDE